MNNLIQREERGVFLTPLFRGYLFIKKEERI